MNPLPINDAIANSTLPPDASTTPDANISGEMLRGFSLFRGLDPRDLDRVAAAMTPKRYAPGQTIFEQGEEGNAMYLVQRGRVRVFIKDERQNEITFRFYGTGEIVGEFALLDQQPRSASADADGETVLMELSRAAFDDFLRERPIIGVTMMRSLAERVRYTTHYLEKMLRAVELMQRQDYQHALEMIAVSSDEESIQGMINAFLNLTHSVQARDEAVKRLAGRNTAPARLDLDAADE